MRKIFVFIILACLLSFVAKADNDYSSAYDNFGIDELEYSLDEQTKDFFSKNDIDAKNPDWINNFTSGRVLLHIWHLFTGGIKSPIKTGVLIASIIFISASLISFNTTKRFETAIYAAVLGICVLISASVWQSVQSAVNAVKSCSTFMTAFVPVFVSTLALSGKTVTASATGALLLGAAETISFAASFAVLPLMGGYLALSIASGVSPLLNNSGIVEGVKKLSMWIMSLLGTVFVGVLGIQTAVNSAADSVTLRTAKFILGTSVPVAGGVLSEAVATVSTSMGLLRSSVGVYGVAALAITLLPIIAELVLWRCVLMLNISLAELFVMPKITGILRAVDSMLAVLLGVILLVGALFIISLSVVIMAGKS